jgi:tetratricopeptide (TPR) repeat protein
VTVPAARITRTLASLLGLVLLEPASVPLARAEEPAPEAVARASGDQAERDLEHVLAPLWAPTGDEPSRRAAAAAAERLGAPSVAAIDRRLAEERKTSPGLVAAAIKSARDAAAGGSRGNADADVTELLLRASPDRDGPGYKSALTTAVLVRALGKIGTTPAVRAMVRVAIDHGGALRPEVARQVKALGDKAVPALIETRKEPSSELRHWAFAQLEAMGTRVPGDAVQTKDNRVLADVLHAYALVHDMDALPVLLSFVNSDRIQVRGAARDALADFGQDAIWKLREAYANVTGKPAPDGYSAAEVRKELFAAYDRLRLQEVYGLLDEGLAATQEGKLDEATEAFDKVLARQPMIERRSEMFPAYVAYAAQVEPSDPGKARALYEKALRLWPETSRRPQIEAEIAYLEGKELLGRGVADSEPFERALRLDPTHAGARAELTRLENDTEAHEQKIRGFAAGAAVVIVGVLGILLFGSRRRSRRALRA